MTTPRVNWKSFALRHLVGRGAGEAPPRGVGVPLWVFGSEAERAPARYEAELVREGLMVPCTHSHKRFQITEAGERYLRDSFQTASTLLRAHAAEAAAEVATDTAGIEDTADERGTQ
jgi:hypothetical protein